VCESTAGSNPALSAINAHHADVHCRRCPPPVLAHARL